MCDNQAIVDRLAAQLADTPNDRLREVMIALVRSLHSFVEDVALTQQEWGMGIEFLTATGKMCDEHRQEFILLSDVLGISMLVDQIDHRSELSTESTVLGPFYRDNSPARSFGEAIFERPSGVPTYYHGRVLAVDGAPIGGATVDVWQNGDDMLYAAQDRTAPPNNLRGLFTTGTTPSSVSDRSTTRFRPTVPWALC